MQKRENQIVSIPCIKISGQGVTLFSRLEGYTKRTSDSPRFNTISDNVAPDKQEKPIINKPEILDYKTIAGIKNSIFTLLWLSDCNTFLDDYCITSTYRKLSFMTLTMPSQQMHPDTFIKKHILNQFLIEMRRDFDNFLYVWRSEKQHNGSLHFHLLINKYYSNKTLQIQWNRILEKYNYVTAFTDKFMSMSFDEYSAYVNKHYNKTITEAKQSYDKGNSSGWKNPPSTHIQSLKNVGNIAGYISKELTKENQIIKKGSQSDKWKFPLSGRNWSASEQITKHSFLSTEITSDIEKDISRLNYLFKERKFTNDYITHFSINPNDFRKCKLYNLDKMFQFFLHT
jgi:hypothetical protein